MVKVTLEFPSVEAAIASLGHLMTPKKTAPVSAGAAVGGATSASANAGTGEQPPAGAPSAPATRTRKPRADAGKPREPYGPRTTEANAGGAGAPTGTGGAASAAAPSAASPAAASTEPAAQASTAAPAGAPAAAQTAAPTASAPAAAGPLPSEKDAQEALEKLFNATNIGTSQEVMSRFGVKRVREIKPELRAEFIKLADETRVAAEAAKTKGGAA